MNYFFIILLILLLVIIFYLYYVTNKQYQNLKETKIEEFTVETIAKCEAIKEEKEREVKEFQQSLEEKQKNLKQILALETQKHEINISKLEKAEKDLESLLKEKEKRYNEVNQDLEIYKEGKIKEINSAAAEYEQRKRLENVKAIEEHNNSMKKASAELQEQLLRSEQVLKDEIETIKSELEEERNKRAAINEEIMRQRQVEEQQDFYRIQLDPNDKDDIEILKSVSPRLRHPEAINKVIWTGYYQKPLAELRKRLLPNGDVSCVYMATRMKTGEVYVGQTTSFDKRLQEHTRSALGIGTLASSQLHRKMLEDGPENYIWQILEIVPKDKLRERESYYIDFYDSKTYGLNSVTGDKK